MGFLKKSNKEDPPPPPPPQEVDDDEALTDEDSSYGPVPPPPPGTMLVEDHQAAYDLEKQQLGNGNNISTEDEEDDDDDDDDDDIGMPDKHDPPSHDGNEVLEEGYNNHDDEDEDDDESVEIPPTSVVQRMIETEKDEYLEKESSGRFCQMGAIIACCLIILATILGVGFGTGAFTKNSTSAAEEPAEDANNEDRGEVTTAPVQGRQESIMLFLASESTVPSLLEEQGAADAAALEWLINEDPLQLGVDTVDVQVRLLQRYALLTLWFSDPEKAWTDSTGWLEAEDECTWFGVSCSQQDFGGQAVNVVAQIDMVDNNVKSTLPSDLVLLESLTTLK